MKFHNSPRQDDQIGSVVENNDALLTPEIELQGVHQMVDSRLKVVMSADMQPHHLNKREAKKFIDASRSMLLMLQEKTEHLEQEANKKDVSLHAKLERLELIVDNLQFHWNLLHEKLNPEQEAHLDRLRDISSHVSALNNLYDRGEMDGFTALKEAAALKKELPDSLDAESASAMEINELDFALKSLESLEIVIKGSLEYRKRETYMNMVRSNQRHLIGEMRDLEEPNAKLSKALEVKRWHENAFASLAKAYPGDADYRKVLLPYQVATEQLNAYVARWERNGLSDVQIALQKEAGGKPENLV